MGYDRLKGYHPVAVLIWDTFFYLLQPPSEASLMIFYHCVKLAKHNYSSILHNFCEGGEAIPFNFVVFYNEISLQFWLPFSSMKAYVTKLFVRKLFLLELFFS